jgi:putative transposase
MCFHNAYAERLVRSIKDECLSRVILFGDRHLRRTMAAFIEHDHHEQNHQSVGNEFIERARALTPRRRVI